MNKYQPLTEHLRRQSASQYPIKFNDIENIIGGELPPSAFKHRAWWSNNPSNSVMTKAWLEAGWISSNVDLEEKKLVFRRVSGPPSPPPQNAAPTNQDGRSLTISGLSAETMSRLQIRAELAGETTEQVVRRIITENAKLTMSERLALADRIRTAGPKLHQLDVPSMIRQDRDAR
ncbi:MAG: DUF7662 domain-containing protein [Hyphomicrobiales bacterium]